MSFPLCVLPSLKTSTPSSFMARTMAVVVTARPSGVVLKYLRPATPRWNAPHWMAISPSRTSASRQSIRRAALAPCCERDRRDVRRRLLVGLRQVGGVGVDVQALAGQPGHRAARVEPSREGDADLAAGRRQRAMNAAHGENPYHERPGVAERSRTRTAEVSFPSHPGQAIPPGKRCTYRALTRRTPPGVVWRQQRWRYRSRTRTLVRWPKHGYPRPASSPRGRSPRRCARCCIRRAVAISILSRPR